jgi:hypothetical protein
MPRQLSGQLSSYTVADLLSRAVERHLATVKATGTRPARPDPNIDPAAAVIDATRQALTAVRYTKARKLPEQALWEAITELTVLGHDLEEAIEAGAGLDPLLVSVIMPYCVDPPVLDIWPGLAPTTPAPDATVNDRLLAAFGRAGSTDGQPAEGDR